MILIIDAYNVLKQALGVKKVSESEKNRLISWLNSYAKNKGHSIILVFDAGPFEWPSKEQVGKIYVVHSGVNENADTWIKNYMTRYKMNDLLLISTDRELGSFAWRLNIQSMDALDFYHLLLESVSERESDTRHAQHTTIKLSDQDQPELDDLMQQASKTVPTKSEDAVKNRASKSLKHSKKERKMIQKLKKL